MNPLPSNGREVKRMRKSNTQPNQTKRWNFKINIVLSTYVLNYENIWLCMCLLYSLYNNRRWNIEEKTNKKETKWRIIIIIIIIIGIINFNIHMYDANANIELICCNYYWISNAYYLLLCSSICFLIIHF